MTYFLAKLNSPKLMLQCTALFVDGSGKACDQDILVPQPSCGLEAGRSVGRLFSTDCCTNTIAGKKRSDKVKRVENKRIKSSGNSNNSPRGIVFSLYFDIVPDSLTCPLERVGNYAPWRGAYSAPPAISAPRNARNTNLRGWVGPSKTSLWCKFGDPRSTSLTSNDVINAKCLHFLVKRAAL